MSVSKNAQIRYLAIDRCLQSKGKFGTKELKKECERALSDHLGEEVEISIRQIQIDLDYLQRENGYAAPIENYTDPLEKRKKYYRYSDPDYSVRKQPLKPDDREALNEALQSLLAFEGRPEVQWIHELIGRIQPGSENTPPPKAIAYEENPDTVGLEHVHTLFQAIRKKIPLKITYKPFDKPEVLHFISPYLLKEYNNRWYILCKSNHFEHLTCLALDRIELIEETKNYEYLHFPEGDKPEDFFDDFIGVTWEKNPLEKILIHVKKNRLSYITTKPIHNSQSKKTISVNEDWEEITLKLIPNKEFYSQMLFFGDDVRVVSPDSVRKKMKSIVNNMYNHYHD